MKASKPDKKFDNCPADNSPCRKSASAGPLWLSHLSILSSSTPESECNTPCVQRLVGQNEGQKLKCLISSFYEPLP